MQEVVIEGSKVDILEKIKKARSKDKEIVRVVEEMKKVEVKVLQGNEWQIEKDLVLKEGKIYVPKDGKLRAEIIQLHHDVPVVGYVLWQPLVTMTNSNTSNKSLSRITSGDYKRTQQGVSAGLLHYLYKLHMVHATNNYSCPNVHASSISTP